MNEMHEFVVGMVALLFSLPYVGAILMLLIIVAFFSWVSSLGGGADE